MSCLDVSCEVNMPRRSGTFDRPIAPAGTPSTGRIARLLVGQAHGFIRVRNGCAIFFHRADLRDAATFNTLQGRRPRRVRVDQRSSERRACDTRRPGAPSTLGHLSLIVNATSLSSG
jgi:hypothetical protein